MKRKSDLKRKVLRSLLAASTMGIFYSSDALAASINGYDEFIPDANGNIVITEDEQLAAGSHHFVIAQGDKLVIATEGNVNSLLADIKNANDDLTAIRKALADHSVVGVVGGEARLDDATISSLGLASFGLGSNESLQSIINKILAIDTIGQNNNIVTINKDTNLIVGDATSNPVVIGMVGGDLALNPSLGIASDKGSQFIEITRNGTINNTINSGNVIGGVGGSTAISMGNISGNIKLTIFGSEQNMPITSGGKTTTTINGDINTATSEGSTANIGAFANGGAAVAIGGQANSIVNGNSTLIIDSNVKADSGIDGITAGVVGGGVALTTIGGTANSEVNGNVNIGINNGLAIGIVGGGVAGSADITGAAEGIYKVINQDEEDYKDKQYGHDGGYMDADAAILEEALNIDLPDALDDLDVKIDNAIQGGEATATVKGDTSIELTGNTTAIGVIGGGVAAASHTYTWKNDGTKLDAGLGEDDVNKAYGRSNATANTGKATIVVNLESPNKDAVAANIGGALSSVISAVKDGDLSKINAEGVVGQGAAVGVFGGGVAFGHGSLRGTIDGEGEEAYGAYAVANNEGGADIILNKGYAAGVFGGGAAGTLNNAKAETNTGAVNTYIGKDMKAVGVFGGGFAVSMEGEKSDDDHKGTTNGTLAYSNVDSNNIEVYGNVDGLYGGGMAIGNSVLSSDNPGKDAATHVGTTNITVNGGKIEQLQLISIMDASKNDNNDGYPWWNHLGMNASMAMSDLKGITDETSIAAGGMAMGMSGSDSVDKAYITINGGEITKDILGGGIAVDNSVSGSGSHVGESTITLNGGTVGGSIYAGGAINGTTPEAIGDIEVEGHKGFNTDATSATVGKATVILNGTEVTGEISGQGYKLTTNYSQENNYNPFYNGNRLSYEKEAYGSVGDSTLVITGNNTLSPLVKEYGKQYTTQNGSKIHSFNIINVKDGSVTTLEGLTTDSAAIIDATGTFVNVDGSAKLDINALEKGTTADGNVYKVISNTDGTDKAWDDSNLVYDRTAGYATGSAVATGSYDITYKDLSKLTEEEKTDAVNDFVGSLGEGGENFEGAVNGIIRNGENTFAGAEEFFREASSTGDNSGLAAMAMIGEAAGVTAGTINVAGDMADNSVLRLSFTQDDITGEPTVNEDGAVWAKYIHSKHDLDGMASSFGSIDSSSDFDGATVGVDFAKKGKVQSGIAFSYGDGDSHGMGINNDFDMWGLTLYGNVKNDDTNVIADIGFSESDNELTGKAMGKDIKADRDVSVFTVGVRAEKMYTNGSTQIVPYTGLRYYNVDPDSYTAYYDGAKFAEYDADRQNIWTLPVGVSLRNETVTESGWKIVPQANVAYIWAFGDTDNSVDLNTGSGMDTLDYTVMDSGSWLGSLGIEAGKDDWNFGLGYSYQKGSHAEANKWFVNLEYSF